MRQKNSLRNNVDHHKIFVNEDLPTEVRQNRDQLREISTYAREKGYTSKVSGDKLLVNDKVYQKHELDLLPNDILLEKVRTRHRGYGIAF